MVTKPITSMEKHGSPNPTYGKLLPVDWVLLIYVHLRVLLWDFPFHLMTYPFAPSQDKTASLGTSFYFLYIRRTSEMLNHRCIRAMGRLPNPSAAAILESHRYHSSCHNLYQPISRRNFTGYWVIQSPQAAQPAAAPQTPDVTIFYLHGGGYFAQDPASYLLLLLRLAESLLARGFRVSVFALDYRLAPEHPFPAQLQDALAAYRYLVAERGIPARKIVVAGDSAGAHLALSLAVHLQTPWEGLEGGGAAARVPKPGGMVLLSPWLSVCSRPYSSVRNAYKDTLSASFLTTVARRFLGSAPPVDMARSRYLEFLDPDPAVDWDVTLPEWTWVFSGRDEIMVDDHLRWVGMVQGKLGEGRVSAEFMEGKEHVWQWMETLDGRKKKKFLDRKESAGAFESIERIGEVIAESLAANKSLKSRG